MLVFSVLSTYTGISQLAPRLACAIAAALWIPRLGFETGLITVLADAEALETLAAHVDEDCIDASSRRDIRIENDALSGLK
mmetsp:Transcript_70055/g.123829  ORF Transcript_70055/g.123829 Transcript_70055/m.123829 type:complete len:81 (-) Transcript_70055:60-302(-)